MKKRLSLFVSVMVAITLIAGCNNATGSAKIDNKIKTTVTKKGPLDPSYKEFISGAKTSYFVPADNGDHSYLKKNHPLVQEVTTIVQDFSRDISERDYRNDDGKKEYKWYAKDVVQQLTSKKDPEKTLAEFKKYEVVQKVVDTAVDGIMFSNSGNAAQVAFENKIRWEKASPDYLSKNKISINTVYKMQGVAVLTKEDGQWKVTGVRFSKPEPNK